MSGELTPREAAARLGATTRTVQRWIATGALPARRVGGRWRVATDALDAFAGRGDARAAATRDHRPLPIRRLLVANRGEIAARIATTCRRLGLEPLIPGVGPVQPVELLDPEAVVALARATGADAVHPGYGFLSEQAAFAERVIEAGLRWVGPPPEALSAVGDKAAARRLAARLGIPIAAGYDGDAQADGHLSAEAERIGFPVLVKPAAGGGGKGMRVVRDPSRLPDALVSARREAAAAFGDDRLILERFVEGPRHVEIQVLFDAAGTGVHLGERDCSIQRRHQKVLEEAPSPGVDDALRARLGEAALQLAAAVGYVGAGTCEFLVDDRGAFFFLEMNARLQVEHPVTEATTGRDLVADQLAIAGGATLADLGLDQATADAARRRGGHAVEVRLYAEDAEASFLPATGRVVDLRWPPGASAFAWDGSDVRIDAGIETGTDVGSRFDPMLAKLIARGGTRDAALARLARGLDETRVLGLVTNLRFLRWLVRSSPVTRGEARIDTLERTWPPDGWSEAALPDEAWATAAAVLVASPVGRDAWSGGWRLNGPPRVRVAAESEVRSTAAADDATGLARVAGDPGTVHVDVAGRSVEFTLAPPPTLDRAATSTGDRGATEVTLLAPMPGAVLAVHAGAGDAIAAGAPVVTIEAMKMEHVVAAPVDGRVDDLIVAAGDQVARGAPIARIAPVIPSPEEAAGKATEAPRAQDGTAPR
ncbi:MAG TPA: biotin carboxylase N-terminal domain-containing protein [Candidatus Limnocylindrales bacterium]|nr:biotin carboxylase N-terminal domain-containing protein [Candidatus Limnocylindrales bacterium]